MPLETEMDTYHGIGRYLRTMNTMKPLKSLLKRWTQLIEERSLAGVDRITTTWWCSSHSQERVRRGVNFI
jgi:hypothetical protein